VRRLALLGLLFAGCPLPGSEPRVIIDERFEDDLAARWTITGAYHLAATIHPAEHGLFADGPLALRAALGIVVYDQWSDGEWLEYSTDCPGAPELWNEGQPDGSALVVALLPMSGTPTAWRRVHASIAPVTAEQTLSALELRVDVVGACAIDNLRFEAP
jgi:hypothetical protein